MTRPMRRWAGSDHVPMRRPGFVAAAMVALSAGALGTQAGASVPASVLTLTGPVTFPRDDGAFNIDATFSYDTKRRTINGFSVSYTCHGRPAVNDSDVHTIIDGGDDRAAVANVAPDGSVRFALKGKTSRFSEDGTRAQGPGKLVVDARLTRIGRKRILKGTAKVLHPGCPSARLTFRTTGTPMQRGMAARGSRSGEGPRRERNEEGPPPKRGPLSH